MWLKFGGSGIPALEEVRISVCFVLESEYLNTYFK